MNLQRALDVTAYVTVHIALAGSIGFAGLGEWSLAIWTFMGFLMVLYYLWRRSKETA